MANLCISAEEADLLANLLKPRIALLLELLEAQVQHCAEGDSSWASTSDALELVTGLMTKVASARLSGAKA